jgi:hypothetical protein
MKKILILFIILLLTGCTNNSKEYTGKETELSKLYLDKGYEINIFRSMESTNEYGKAYVTMTYNVIADYVSIADYDNEDTKITKKKVSNIRIINTPKKGFADELYGNYNGYSGELLTGTKNYYETKYEVPHTSGIPSSIAVTLNQIGLYDQSKSPIALSGAQPTFEDVCNELGISLSDVTLTLGFRVELTTVSGKTLYKDYEVQVPTKDFDLGGSEFQIDKTTTDGDPFLEKQ